MRRPAPVILMILLLGCGTVSSDSSDNTLSIGGCDVLLPVGWKVELEKSETTSTNGLIVTNSGDSVKFLRDIPIVRDATLVNRVNIIQTDTIEEYLIQRRGHNERKDISVMNTEWSDGATEHYYLLAQLYGDIEEKEINEFIYNIKAAIKEMNVSCQETLRHNSEKYRGDSLGNRSTIAQHCM
jgi:hypothetical protein